MSCCFPCFKKKGEGEEEVCEGRAHSNTTKTVKGEGKEKMGTQVHGAIPGMALAQSEIKLKLKGVTKAVQDLIPLYKNVSDYYKALEGARRAGEQVAHKLLELGLSKDGSEWGQSFVMVGEVQHKFNKSFEVWVSVLRDFCATNLANAADQNREELQALSKDSRIMLTDSVDMPDEAATFTLSLPHGDAMKQKQQAARRTFLDKRKYAIMAELDAFENNKCGSFAKSWADVMMHQPYTANATAISDVVAKLNRSAALRASVATDINSSSGSSVPAPSPLYPVLDGFDQPMSIKSRSSSYTDCRTVPFPDPTVYKRGSGFMNDTKLSSSVTVPPSMLSLPLPASSSLINMTAPKSPQTLGAKTASSMNLKAFIGKLKTLSPVTSPRDETEEAANRAPTKTVHVATPPHAHDAAEAAARAHRSATVKIKKDQNNSKRRRHTLMSAEDLTKNLNLAAAAVAQEDNQMRYPPKRNFAYQQEVPLP